MVVDWMNFVHKPTKIRAFKWKGTAIPPDAFTPEDRERFGLKVVGGLLSLMTNIGPTFVQKGWWIVQAEWGEVYAISPDVFERAYARKSTGDCNDEQPI